MEESQSNDKIWLVYCLKCSAALSIMSTWKALYKVRSESAHTFYPFRWKIADTHPCLPPCHSWFNNVCMQLICLLPFSFSFSCLFSLYKPLFRRQGAYCWVPNNVLPLTDSRVWGRAYSMMVTYFARFVFTFCIEWYCGSFFWDVRCHFASHACLLVASCCLPDPLNAPLCSYVDMAPSAVGHCPFCVSSEVRFVITSVLNLTDYTSNSKAVG